MWNECKGNDCDKSCILNCFLAVPLSILGHSRGDSLTNPILIIAFVQF